MILSEYKGLALIAAAGFISDYVKSKLINEMMGVSFDDLIRIYEGEEVDDIPKMDVQKMWVHDAYGTPDKPRADHVGMDGETISINEDYSIGFNPRESGEASEDIHCSCRSNTEYSSDGDIGKLLPNQRYPSGISSVIFG